VHPYLDHAEPIALAHRGGGEPGRENSMAAFEDAVRVGFRYLETDLRVTRDGMLVAFHDAALDRVTDRSGAIAELSWDEVRRARIGGMHPIPRLDELVSTFPEARLNLDLKSDRAVAPLIVHLQRVPALLDRVCIGSFSDARIDALRRAFGPRVCTSAGPLEVRRLRLASLAGRVADRVRIAADCLQVPPRHGRVPLVDRPFLSAARRRGLPVHVWTINDAPTMDAMLDRGVQGVVTDRTRLLREVLRRRGQWHPQNRRADADDR
jgi:glycerophosphoryl diester phosphodiesterase